MRIGVVASFRSVGGAMGQNVVFWAFWVFPKFQILFSFNFVIKVSNNIVRAINVVW